MSDFVMNFQFVGRESDDSDCDDTEKNYAKDAQERYETHLKNDEKNDEKIVLEKHFFFKERFPLS
mgnify:CR=1 FL=1